MVLEEQNGRLVYSDGGSVEEQLLAIAQQHPDTAAADYIADDSRYTINNTFSPVRRNLLNWYPFKPGGAILEVGAGMGSMTGLLCDVAESVTSIEMNENRANVIRARYPERKNLSIISADVTAWHTKQRFDYIVVVGVLEYAGVFNNGVQTEPYILFMEALRRLLKPNGVVLLSIENRFGLKYWLGGSEDHLQKPFLGIEGYKEPRTPRTFSKAELSSIFTSAGYNAQRFYYVLPDYKFPTGIFTDAALPSMQELLNINFTYSAGSTLVGNEKDLYANILANGMFENFANSYLVEIASNSLPQEFVMQVSGRGECKPEYRIVTSITNTGKVEKKADDERAIAHVTNIVENAKRLAGRGVKHLECSYENGVLRSSVCLLPKANNVFCDALNHEDWATLQQLIELLSDAIKLSSDTTETPSPLLEKCPALKGIDVGPLLKDGYMDLTLYNAFWQPGELIFYDQEWNFPGLPQRFILYYGLKTTYNRNKGVTKLPFVEIMRYIGVSEEEAAGWNELESFVWSQIFNRLGDVYGADGYCNIYDEKLTLSYQQKNKEERASYLELENNRLGEENRRLSHETTYLSGETNRLEKELATIYEENTKRYREFYDQLDNKNVALDKIVQELMNYDIETRNRECHERNMNQAIADLQAALQHEASQLHSAQIEIAQIRGSRSWRYSFKLTQIARRFFPVGSMRAKAMGSILRVPLKIRRSFRKAPGQARPQNLPQTFDGYAPFTIPAFETPLVSIIIPVYNQFDYTYKCIQNIVEHCAGMEYEIIIADDNSGDQTARIEKLISGLQVIHNPKNLRFLLNCNNAAKTAKGEYIVFLNNDTLVHPNWLQSLVAVLEEDSKAGMVGSKIIYPDGRLQEAGGIVWNDASAWNYGHGQSPELSEFNYLKEVDYISGCSIMIRRSLWETIGGFDEQFAPAYYEDTDLAFAVRKQGYKVMYQPLSVVIHFEGVTNGSDVTSGQKQYQIKNQSVFLNKWKKELAKNHYNSGEHVLRARDRSKNKKILLMVDHYIPTYNMDAGSRSVYNYIKLFLQDNYHVILVPDNFYQSDYTTHYQQMGVEVLYGNYYFSHWKDWMLEHKEEFDVAFLNRPHISIHYIDFLRKNTHAKILYFGHDLHFLREQREYELTKNPELLYGVEKWKVIEFTLMRQADCSFYPSYAEEDYIKSVDSKINVLTLPLYIYPALERKKYKMNTRKDIMFVGGFLHKPNVDAMVWFVEKVFPLILEKNPEITLHIVGSKPTPEILAMDSAHIKVHGFVSDEKLAQFYQDTRLSVVPLRFGAGLKGKVVEAMAAGIPIVTTDIGAEGIKNDTEFLAVANDEKEFASTVNELYNNEQKLAAMCTKAYDYIEATFSNENAQDIISKALR